MRFLPSHKTKAIEHTCGNPPTYHTILWIEALNRWKCAGCGKILAGP